MEFGISVYLSGDYEKNLELLKRSHRAGIRGIFTSLIIPEENFEEGKERFFRLLSWACAHEMEVCADVSPRAVEKLKLSRIEELYGLGIRCLRLDAGFTDGEMAELSKKHPVMINASCIGQKQLLLLREKGMCFENVTGCHNYYPKPHTGLGEFFYRRQNELFHRFGIRIITFIPGDRQKRGPLGEGLPTLEFFRRKPLGYNAAWVYLNREEHDAVYIGDPDFSEEAEEYAALLSRDCLPLPARIQDERYAGLFRGRRLHFRPDRGEDTLRVQESRIRKEFQTNPEPAAPTELKRGDIVVSNKNYGRYCNEVEILLRDLPADGRYNVIGRVEEVYISLLDLLDGDLEFEFICKE